MEWWQVRSLGQQTGMSLVELMVTLGISTLLLMALLMGAQSMFKADATSDASQNLTAMMYEVNGILNNPDVCTLALANAKNIDKTEVILSNAIRAGGAYGKLKMNSVHLINVANISGANYRAEIEIDGQRNNEVYGSKNFIQRTSIYYSENAGLIQQCLSSASDPSVDCQSLGGNWINGSKCDFCSALGGALQSDGRCLLSGAAVSDCTIPAKTAWTVGGATCLSDLDLKIAHGTVGTVIASGSPSGSATYYCNNGAVVLAGSPMPACAN
jgi:hypothetical protein